MGNKGSMGTVAHDHRWRAVTRSVRHRMDILRSRGSRHCTAIGLNVLQQPQTGLDDWVVRVKIGGPSIGVDGIRDLVVARLIQGAEVKPDFGDVWVDADGTGVGVEGITVLVDVVVQHADAAPEHRVAPIPVHGLIHFVGLLVLLDGHVGMARKVPTLCITAIYEGEEENISNKAKVRNKMNQRTPLGGLFQALDCHVLIDEGRARLMVQPAEHLCMVRKISENMFVRVLGSLNLWHGGD